MTDTLVMTSLRRALVAGFAAVLAPIASARDAHAMFRAAFPQDLSAADTAPMTVDDASPSVVAAGDGTWIAWARTPADPSVTNWSAIALSRATPTAVDHSPPDLVLADAYLYDVSIAHDGTSPVVLWARGSTADPTMTTLGFWHPTRAINQLVTGYVGRSLDLEGSRYINHGLMPFVAAFTGGGSGYQSAKLYFTCDGSYAGCTFTTSGATSTYFDGHASLVAGEARYLASRNDGTNAMLQTLGSDVVAVPNGYRVNADFFGRDTGDFVVLTATASNALRLSIVDTSNVVHTALSSIPTAGTIDEVAIAPDRLHTAWIAALEGGGSLIQLFAEDGTGTLTSISMSVPSAFPRCQRLHIAPFAADPDVVAIVAQCIDNTAGTSHVFYWTVGRLPDVTLDAGTDGAIGDSGNMPDAIAMDASDANATDGIAGDAIASDANENDAFASDATATDAETDGSAPIDAAPSDDAELPNPGTGPGFRGSGCSCTVPADTSWRATHGRVAIVAVGLVLALEKRRRARSS